LEQIELNSAERLQGGMGQGGMGGSRAAQGEAEIARFERVQAREQ
jgi:hypothetical protein